MDYNYFFVDDELKDLLRQLLCLDPARRLGSRLDPLGPVGGQAVLSHEFFDEVDFGRVLNHTTHQDGFQFDESVHSYTSESAEKKLKRDLQFPEFESFEGKSVRVDVATANSAAISNTVVTLVTDALISWSVKANLTKAAYQSDPLSMSRSGRKDKSRLKREVDEEQFGLWDYISAETVQHEMLATDRQSNLVELKR